MLSLAAAVLSVREMTMMRRIRMTEKQTQRPTGRDAVAPRSAVAASEFAMILPLILLITFGTVEACLAIFLKETATIAAYEGARVATQKGATNTHVRDRIEEVLQMRGANLNGQTMNQVVTITPDASLAATMEPITVTVNLSCGGNTIFPTGHLYGWFGSGQVQGEVVMIKEFRND